MTSTGYASVCGSAGHNLNNDGAAQIIGAALNGVANAGWFGDGRDGDVHIVSGQTYTITVKEDSEIAVFQPRTLVIDNGGQLTTSGRCQGLVIRCKGACTINGTINMDYKSPRVASNETDAINNSWVKLPRALATNLIGGSSGDGGISYDTNGGNEQLYSGGSGGVGFELGGAYGAGGAGQSGNGGSSTTRPPVSLAWPHYGSIGAGSYGSGGGSRSSGTTGGGSPGGGGSTYNFYGVNGSGTTSGVKGNAGNAYGGGAIFLYVGGELKIGSTGVLTACGGNGATPVSGNHYNSYPDEGQSYSNSMNMGGGGGGGGGVVVIVYATTIQNSGNLRVSGGKGGVTGATGTWPQRRNGKDGTVGATYVGKFSELLQAAQ